MKYLWSPWRMDYIENPKNEEGCLFCNRLDQVDGPENLILLRRPTSFVILNRYPYTNGHMMIVPNKHVPTLIDLEEGTLSEMMLFSRDAIRVLREVYGAESFNIGVNIGEVAGAGIAEHVHIHVVPRWAGDTSFMTTTAQARVIPEDLDETYRRLHAAWHTSNT